MAAPYNGTWEMEGTNFRRTVDNARCALAINYALNTRYSLGVIGYLLGFSDHSNFTHAFRRRTGGSPNKYRMHNAETVAGNTLTS